MFFRLISLVLFATLLAFGATLSNREAAQNNENPKVVQMIAPVYPAIARNVHASGTVVIEVELDADGRVTSALIIRGHPFFSNASMKAAKAWHFEHDPNSDSCRKVQLTFDYDRSFDCNQVSTISPYHLRISPEPPPDTVSYIPDDGGATHCKVHGTRLLRDKVEITYGLIGFRQGYWEAEKKLFPQAYSQAFGGCLVEKQVCNGNEIQLSPRYAEVLYCPVCRRAEAKWSKQHSHNPIQP